MALVGTDDLHRSDAEVVDGSRRLVVVGWSLVVLVAALMVPVSGMHELGPAIISGCVGIAFVIWTLKRWNRAARITALILGVIWTLQFAGYSVAGATDDPFELDIFVVDLIGVLAGLLIVIGSIRSIRGAMHARAHRTP